MYGIYYISWRLYNFYNCPQLCHSTTVKKYCVKIKSLPIYRYEENNKLILCSKMLGAYIIDKKMFHRECVTFFKDCTLRNNIFNTRILYIYMSWTAMLLSIWTIKRFASFIYCLTLEYSNMYYTIVMWVMCLYIRIFLN